MLKNYNFYIKENNNNKTSYEIDCKIDENYLIEISGQININDAIRNEMGWINTIFINEINKIENGIYRLSVIVDNKIIYNTDAHDIMEAIFYEFSWLKDSGIFIKNIIE